jgi:hypothetical protein
VTAPRPHSQPDTESAAFAKAYPHLDLDQIPDPWGRPIFKHSHVRALWEGWFARACLDDHPQCGVQTPDDARAFEDMTLASNARKAAIEECARIVEGRVVHENYREWPQVSSQGNRADDSYIVQHCDKLAAAIRSLALSSADRVGPCPECGWFGGGQRDEGCMSGPCPRSPLPSTEHS